LKDDTIDSSELAGRFDKYNQWISEEVKPNNKAKYLNKMMVSVLDRSNSPLFTNYRYKRWTASRVKLFKRASVRRNRLAKNELLYEQAGDSAQRKTEKLTHR